MKNKTYGVNVMHRKSVTLTPPKYNFLKYHRIVMYYAKKKYDLHSSDLDMLLFLHDEDLFTAADFKEYEQVFSWDRKRFERLRDQGWIKVWRENVPFKHGALYRLSKKGMNAVEHVYDIFEGRIIPEDANMFKKQVPFSDKVYRNYIRKMNLKNREGRPKNLK
jgi:hypothetical protein